MSDSNHSGTGCISINTLPLLHPSTNSRTSLPRLMTVTMWKLVGSIPSVFSEYCSQHLSGAVLVPCGLGSTKWQHKAAFHLGCTFPNWTFHLGSNEFATPALCSMTTWTWDKDNAVRTEPHPINQPSLTLRAPNLVAPPSLTIQGREHRPRTAADARVRLSHKEQGEIHGLNLGVNIASERVYVSAHSSWNGEAPVR
eukprot:3036147-Rhodomonas_salina.1